MNAKEKRFETKEQGTEEERIYEKNETGRARREDENKKINTEKRMKKKRKRVKEKEIIRNGEGTQRRVER